VPGEQPPEGGGLPGLAPRSAPRPDGCVSSRRSAVVRSSNVALVIRPATRPSKKVFSQRSRRVDCYPTEHLAVTRTEVRVVARDQRSASQTRCGSQHRAIFFWEINRGSAGQCPFSAIRAGAARIHALRQEKII
jgi:hypothetical protein